jgi:peptidoglycan hydrolase CwlO-like protein
MNKRIWILLLLVLFFLLPLRRVFAQQSCSDPEQSSCRFLQGQSQVDCYQQARDACSSQENTLDGEINYMNNQIQLTTIQIQVTQVKINTLLTEISQLETEVQRLEDVLNTRLALLLHRIPAAYKRAVAPQFGVLLFSGNLSDFITRAAYLQAVQKEDAALVFEVKSTQNSYNDSKKLREDKKTQLDQVQMQLEAQSQQLAQQKQAKNALLAETQGQEAVYQQLLAAAKAQLAGFSSFASSQGGATILSNQTTCDDWGCYYNQRDSQWGNVALNNTGYSIASDGCLLTSMAMMYTHYGHRGVTPLTINANPSNFAAYYPAFLNRTIVADGTTSTRVGSEIDSQLSGGNPVIVGIRYSNGDTHFIVLLGGSNGNYTMNDPFVPNGHKINFADHYSLGSVYEIDRVSM